MVSYDCPTCGGNGVQEVLQVRNGNIKRFTDNCSMCYGIGSMTNGRPNVDYDVGITDPDPVWKVKWGKDYKKQLTKGEF
ncbi:hypothetical protein QGM71_01370 [Virgibacillus sp. C22-A2]|uniref:Uncharacterized protein n=1 Tax=Virgibacillus tibetensis TaxID=3042313 RepID=A0ABU6K9X3_9BACI|nr:hypothetical protein [Virgibacillus sp. C22-A2]